MSAAVAVSLDCGELSTRVVNARLQAGAPAKSFVVGHPAGRHAPAAGLRAPIHVQIAGHAGYYCAGMNQQATVRVAGNAGVGVAENMMSGEVEVIGSTGQSAAASAQGGRLIVRGDAAARCAIALKGADVIVCGSAGHGSVRCPLDPRRRPETGGRRRAVCNGRHGARVLPAHRELRWDTGPV